MKGSWSRGHHGTRGLGKHLVLISESVFRVQGEGFEVEISGIRVYGWGFLVWGSGSGG